MRQPANMKPFVWRKGPGSPAVHCMICLAELEDGVATLFWGRGCGKDGKPDAGPKTWVHLECWNREYETAKQEAEAHDFSQPVAGVATDSRGGMSVAGGERGYGQDIRDELIAATQQAYDIEAHVGSLLASLRILAGKVGEKR